MSVKTLFNKLVTIYKAYIGTFLLQPYTYWCLYFICHRCDEHYFKILILREMCLCLKIPLSFFRRESRFWLLGLRHLPSTFYFYPPPPSCKKEEKFTRVTKRVSEENKMASTYLLRFNSFWNAEQANFVPFLLVSSACLIS